MRDTLVEQCLKLPKAGCFVFGHDYFWSVASEKTSLTLNKHILTTTFRFKHFNLVQLSWVSFVVSTDLFFVLLYWLQHHSQLKSRIWYINSREYQDVHYFAFLSIFNTYCICDQIEIKHGESHVVGRALLRGEGCGGIAVPLILLLRTKEDSGDSNPRFYSAKKMSSLVNPS